jgi:hypothetical protein
MLPADFKFPADVKRTHHMNPHVVHEGLFVKRVMSPDHLLEPAVSRALTAVGIPHQPVTYQHRFGDHLLVTPHLPDARTLLEATPEDADRITTPHALQTLLAEHVLGIGDRHGGNYLLHPRHGVVTHDFGYNPWHEGVGDSALLQFLRVHKGVKPSTPIPPGVRARKELIAHARVGHSAMEKYKRIDRVAALVKRLRALAGTPTPTVAHFFESA